MDWDLLRTFEVVARAGSFTAAAKTLGISQSTVSRQLNRLEEEAGSPLLVRESPLRLTQRGESLLTAVQPMVDAALAARSALEDTPELRGMVTVTTVGEVVRWALIDHLAVFYAMFPQLRLRILAHNQISSLAAGVADLALRFAKPERGDLVAKKLHTETYAFFASAALPLHADVPWLGLAGSLAQIPEQRHAERAFAGRPARLLVEDVESLGLAVQAGLGVAVLPCGFGSRLHRTVQVAPDQIGAGVSDPIASRDLWLVVHRNKRRLPKIRAVITWLSTALQDVSFTDGAA